MKTASLAFASLASVAAVLSLDPGVARAGGCTPCETSQQCVDALGAPAFCVAWTDGTLACPGTAVPERGCCPGQGCATFSGRPSCEAEGRCVVVGEVDGGSAGTPDAGGPGVDAGTAMDASTDRDAGDAGSGTTGGCGCRVGGARGLRTSHAVLLALVAAVLATRRARRR